MGDAACRWAWEGQGGWETPVPWQRPHCPTLRQPTSETCGHMVTTWQQGLLSHPEEDFMGGPLLALSSGLQCECCHPLCRCLHALWDRAAAMDGLGGHGSLLRVCGSLISAAQVVSRHVAGVCSVGGIHSALLLCMHKADLGWPVLLLGWPWLCAVLRFLIHSPKAKTKGTAVSEAKCVFA